VSKGLSRHAHRGAEAAAAARAALGLGLKLPVDDILALLERGTEMRIFVVRLGDDGIAGAYQWYEGSPWAIVNGDDPVERQRFTLAHEYGHHFLEHSSVVDEQIDWGTTDRQEVQANYFAGAFLAPEGAIEAAYARLELPEIDLDVLVALAVEFGLSAKAMRVRLETLGILSSKASAALDERLAAQEHWGRASVLGLTPINDTLVQAKKDGGRMPAAMVGRALRAVDLGRIPADRLPDLLRVSEAAAKRQGDALATIAE
jgi:Zn-dependent peptidase ImmA (M78 family)